MPHHHRRLITSHHHTPINPRQSPHSNPNRRSHSLFPTFVHQNPRIPQRALRTNHLSRSPQHHHHWPTPRLTRYPNCPLQQILPTQLNQLLRLTQTRRPTRCKHYTRNTHKAHCACRYRATPPSLTCFATSSALNLREAPTFPIHTACASATIASAIASGPSPPRSSPTGA